MWVSRRPIVDTAPVVGGIKKLERGGGWVAHRLAVSALLPACAPSLLVAPPDLYPSSFPDRDDVASWESSPLGGCDVAGVGGSSDVAEIGNGGDVAGVGGGDMHTPVATTCAHIPR